MTTIASTTSAQGTLAAATTSAPGAALRPERPTGLEEAVRIEAGQRRFDFDVAIVGLGYVGLPTALAFHAAGARVLGVDVSARRLEEIFSYRADLVESDRARLDEALEDEHFLLTQDTSVIQAAAAVIVCVPTPIDAHQVPDLKILRGACAMVVDTAVAGQLLMLTSTTYAGCTRDLLVEPLAARGLEAGTDVFVAFSPERIDPGNTRFAQEDVPRVIGGATRACAAKAHALISRYAHRTHTVASMEAAEMTKLLENTFRAVNIAMINEFAEACRDLDVSVTEVIDAAATKPYGFMAFYPGPGVGGHCIPCDPHYLLWQLRKRHRGAPVIEQAMTAISQRPGRTADRVREVLSGAGAGIRDARVLVLGVSYKPDVADLRESPALEIITELRAMGADVGYHDPHFAAIDFGGERLAHVEDPAGFGADLVLLHTRHSAVDLDWIDPRAIVLDATYRATDVPGSIAL
ncbi:nucleotide sugar dehydrogenase [Zafaria sp. Z1313]|uniref:nucleotide sugar dehydrogenase n=1 Tax=unclassified Zafaria TaxID=2828765 RepID=UPI002E791940|nr:nucleotide sugar dehydrogenase [Zafaria sp. J156]MEE1620521.1 nucleotide sugar dehydrogenase [Zafaria sp. J156]